MQQLNKLVEVIEVTDLTAASFVERELVLIKVAVEPARRSEVVEIANIFRGNVVDVGPDSLTVEVTGAEGKVGACVDMLRPYNITELVRSGARDGCASPHRSIALRFFYALAPGIPGPEAGIESLD
jgi:acetolactate synthase-1/3 small subunit